MRLLSFIATLLFACNVYAQQASTTFPDVHTNSPVLGVLHNANFNTTSDQAILLPASFAKYYVTGIYVTNCSTSLTTAAGGFYTAASKGGSVIVAAVQAYTALTGSTVLLSTTLAVTNTAFTANPIYLSLTTGQGSAATCDVYVVGYNLM